MTERHRTESEAETMGVGTALAAALPPGAVLLLHGDLGAGKTAFVRGLAAGLGLDPDEVSSPTFTLVHEYRGGRLPLYHADLYRLPSGSALEDLGLDELSEDGVLAIEWPERLVRPPAASVVVRFAITGDTSRTIEVTPEDVSGSLGVEVT